MAAAARQEVMAVAVLACERVLAALDERPAGWLDEQSRQALAHVPHAARWARGFTRGIAMAPEAFRRRSAPATVHAAVEGIAQACVPQPDQMLYDLLTAAIGECAAWAGPPAGRASRCGTAPSAPGREPRNTAAAH